MRPFELGLVVVFLVAGLLSLVILAGYRGGDGGGTEGGVAVGAVEIWGTFPAAAVQTILTELTEQNETFRSVRYREVPQRTFNQSLITALADGQGPDLLLVSHELLVEQRRRLQPFGYEQFPVRDFRSTYIEGAEIFALPDGIYGYPIAVDPLMLYWNRDQLTTAGFLEAPQTWEVLINSMFPELIERGFDRQVNRSVIAMGEYDNVRNSFATISMLALQGGTRGVYVDTDGRYRVQLQTSSGRGDPLNTAVSFYTRFAQPSNTLYSWNRTLSEDRQEFVAGDLSFYFGFASEGRTIERINPNLNFDIAEVPQSAGSNVRRTYGQFYSLVPLRSTDNPAGAYAVLNALGSQEVASQMAALANMAPVHQSVVSAGSNDLYGRFAYQSAPIAFGWLNPAPSATDQAFAQMVEDVNDNRSSVERAVSDAVSRLSDAY
ncbi:MAG: extracellular solute-binding protein [Patescibacteria group bacterium]